MRSSWLWAVLLAFGACSHICSAAESDGEPRVDLYGDPLPRGAISRLGSLRLRHETNRPVALAFSPDGKILVSVSGGSDKTVRAWEASSGKLLWRLLREVHCLDFSPDGKLLAVGGNEGSSGLIEPESGKLLEEIECAGKVLGIAFSPDAEQIALATNAWPSLQICDYAVRNRTLKAKPSDAVSGRAEFVAYSANGKWLTCAGRGHVFLLDETGGKLINEWEVKPGRISALAFSPGSDRVLAGVDHRPASIVSWAVPSGDGEQMVAACEPLAASFSLDAAGMKLAFLRGAAAIVHDLRTGRDGLRVPVANVGRVAISKGGKLLATFGSRVRVFDAETGRDIHGFPEGFSSDDFRTFSGSGKLFASRRHVWDVETGKILHELKGPGRLVFSPDGVPLALTYGERRLKARSLGDIPFSWEAATDSAAISPATGHALFQSRPQDDPTVTKAGSNLRSLFTGRDEHRLPNEDIGAGVVPEPWRFGLTRDGKQLAVLRPGSHVVELLGVGKEDARSSAERLSSVAQHGMSSLLASPDGKYLAALPKSPRGEIEVLSTAQLEPTAALRDVTSLGYGSAKVGMGFLSDPPQLAVLRGGDDAGAPAVLKVWDVETEGMTAKMQIRTGKDLRQAVLWLASHGLRGDLPSGFVPLGNEDQTLPALQNRLSSELLNTTAAVSRSGELIAIADELSVEVWETATRQLVQRMQSGAETIRALAFSPDDRLLLVHCANETALVFPAIRPNDELKTRDTAALVEDLAGKSAKAARKAMLELVRRKDEALAALDGKFPRKITPAMFRRWIGELESPDAAEVEAAQQKLQAAGPLATPYLRTAVRGTPSDLQIVRIRQLLEHPAETVVDAEVLRGIRGIQVAALIDSAAAREGLRQIAVGDYDVRLANRAAEAVNRFPPPAVKRP